MKPAPLQLERHFFSKIEIDSHPDGKVGTINLLQIKLDIGQADPKVRRFQVLLKFKLEAQPNTKPTYTGEIHAVGIFRVVDGWPENKIAALVQANGAAMLYGAIREMVLNLTSRGPWPPILLNAFSFVPDNKELEENAPSSFRGVPLRKQRTR